MSSWVAPAVAAEMWGTSLQQVMEWVANGTVASYVDGQFLFVDIASRGYERAAQPPPPAPTTNQEPEEVVTPEELTALTRPATEYPVDEDTLPEHEDDSPQRDISQWRSARQSASRQRKAPKVA